MTTEIPTRPDFKRLILAAEQRGVKLELTADGAGVRGTKEDIDRVIKTLNRNKNGIIEALKEFESQACRNCRNRTPYATCGKPVEAGMARKFEVRWPPPDYAKRCIAFKPSKRPQQDLAITETRNSTETR